MSKKQGEPAAHEHVTAPLAKELIITMANLIITERDYERFGDDKQRRKSRDACQDSAQERWYELCEVTSEYISELIDELLAIHTWMAFEWQTSLPHTLGLSAVITEGGGDPIGRAARDLVLNAIRIAYDDADHITATHQAALLNMAKAGNRKSQRALAEALAHLGGQVAAARPLERDGTLFDFKRLEASRDHFSTTAQDPWDQPNTTGHNGDDDPPF